MLSSQKIVQAFEKEGVTHVVGVPDNGSRALFERLWANPKIEVILTSREGEAFGLASGLYLGGATPLVLIQNTGFFEAGDAFRGTPRSTSRELLSKSGGGFTPWSAATARRHRRHSGVRSRVCRVFIVRALVCACN